MVYQHWTIVSQWRIQEFRIQNRGRGADASFNSGDYLHDTLYGFWTERKNKIHTVNIACWLQISVCSQNLQKPRNPIYIFFKRWGARPLRRSWVRPWLTNMNSPIRMIIAMTAWLCYRRVSLRTCFQSICLLSIKYFKPWLCWTKSRWLYRWL